MAPFLHITEDDGLPDSRVNTVMKAPDGRIWAGTWSGVAILDADSGRIADILDADDGLPVTMVSVLLQNPGRCPVVRFLCDSGRRDQHTVSGRALAAHRCRRRSGEQQRDGPPANDRTDRCGPPPASTTKAVSRYSERMENPGRSRKP